MRRCLFYVHILHTSPVAYFSSFEYETLKKIFSFQGAGSRERDPRSGQGIGVDLGLRRSPPRHRLHRLQAERATQSSGLSRNLGN
jgi:hypothetical protein